MQSGWTAKTEPLLLAVDDAHLLLIINREQLQDVYLLINIHIFTFTRFTANQTYVFVYLFHTT